MYLDNPESVIHRFTDCDFEPVIGNMFKVLRGGWPVVTGGSLILYPEHNESGPVVRSQKAAIFNISPNVASIDARAGEYTMRDVSVEKYDPNYQFVRIIQTGSVVDIGDDVLVPRFPASSVDVRFYNTSFRTDTVRPTDSANVPGNHEVVTITGDCLARVYFVDCALNTRHFYKVQSQSMDYSDGSTITFIRPRLLWDPSKENLFSGSWEGGTLADRCENVTSRASLICEGATCITTPKWKSTKRSFLLDFSIQGGTLSDVVRTESSKTLKRAGEPLISTGESYAKLGNSLYMYNGATITGFDIVVPPSAETDTGVIRILSSKLNSADPNSFVVIYETPVVTLSSGYSARHTIAFGSEYTLSNDERLHCKWASYSGTGTNVPQSSKIDVRYK